MTPTASIVIRSFNEAHRIGEVLRAVRRQSFRDVEIILVDSGSTDDTLATASPLCDKVVTIDSRDFTFGYSLNTGCRHSAGTYVVFLSAHAIPANEEWLEHLLAPFHDPQVGMTFGRHVGAEDTKYSEQRDFARLFGPGPRHYNQGMPYSNNANAAIRRSIWDRMMFDEYLSGLEDIAWARRIVEQGYGVVYVPEATVHHIHHETWAQIYNRYRREAIAARKIGLVEPPHASRSDARMLSNIVADLAHAFPRLTLGRIGEIVGFRYHQWHGTRDGWRQDVDVEKERFALYYSGTNRGVVVEDRHRAVLQELPMPEVKPGDVLIRVAYVGVCRTDLEVYEGSLGYYQLGLARYPIVPGHEFSGEVVRVGANGAAFMPGDQVVGECIITCGQCEACRTGRYTSCERRQEVGVINRDGAYARFIALPARHVHKVPVGVDLRTAAMTEPLAVVRKAVRRLGAHVQAGMKCAVIGAGPIGNLCAQVLVLGGCQTTVFDINRARLEWLDGKCEVLGEVDGLERFDVIVEATGRLEVLNRVLAESRADATVLLLGFPYGSTDFNFEGIVARERAILGSVGSSSTDFSWALQQLPRIDTAPFVGHTMRLERFDEAWQLCRSGRHLKILLEVD